MEISYIIGQIATKVGDIPQVSHRLSFFDLVGTLKARWAINRHNYKVEPGLYAIGSPVQDSRVFVTANYKLSFDHLRKNLVDEDAWILVLNTRGINVWCAAGKGTFGTKEIVHKIKKTRLNEVVSHRKLILPQLGAPGVAAHEVFEKTGFHVIYGPVKAEYIKEYLASGLNATAEMRRMTFPAWERIKLTPVEIVSSLKYLIFTLASLFILSGLYRWGYSVDKAVTDGQRAVLNILVAYFSGTVITPILLPWLPFRSFSWKGMLLGILFVFISFFTWNDHAGLIENIGWLLIMPSVSSFLAMNFTGSSTFTSLSGVMKEMKVAVPLQIGMSGLGLLIWIAGRFF